MRQPGPNQALKLILTRLIRAVASILFFIAIMILKFILGAKCGCAFAYSQGHMKNNKYCNVPTMWLVPPSNRETDLGGNSTLPIADPFPDKHITFATLLNLPLDVGHTDDAQ